VPTGTRVELTGEATDPEDVSIPNESFVWTEGEAVLGTGRQLSALLSPGWHTVTLSVSDSDANTGQATFQVFVGYQLFLPIIQR